MTAGIFWLRWFVVLCQTAVIWVTWPLWNAREFPPNLPASFSFFGSFDVGWLLLLTLAFVVVRPGYGTAAHCAALVVSMLMDQTRIQPQVTSLAILMVGTLPLESCPIIARAHLIALWFYAGFHKLLSAGYYESAAMIQSSLVPLGIELEPAGAPAMALKIGAAVTEVVIAGLLLVPKLRRVACVLIVLLHAGILTALTVIGWNPAVWSWNLAVVVAAFAFFWSHPETIQATWSGSSWWLRVVIAYILIAPLGFYLEVTDTYLAHCLYSQNKAEGLAIHPMTSSDPESGELVSVRQEVSEHLGSPLPPEQRLIRAYFERRPQTQPGDYLRIRDIRLGAKWRGRHERWFVMNRDRSVRETIPPKARKN